MSCCGKGRRGKPTVTVNRATEPAPAVNPTTKAPTAPQRPIIRNQLAFQQPKEQQPKELPTPHHIPKSESSNELPKCRYREFRSKQIIGGREVETYFCKAFSMSVRAEHCRACQKHDK